MSEDAQDVLRYVLSCLKRASENAYPWSLTPNEAGILVAEVERLREQSRSEGIAPNKNIDWDDIKTYLQATPTEETTK